MSPLSHRGITGSLAAQGLRVLSLDYRMAPEHPYPAPIVDALSAYKYVLSLGIPASKICMAGDSAGGGLTYATAMYLRDNPSFAPQVAGICPISPWIDLTTSSPSVFIGDEFDADIINRGSYSNTSMQVAYAGGVEQRAKKQMLPLFSPFFDDKKGGLPPALASLATVDRLFAEDLAYYIPRLEKNEATVQVDVYEDQFHVGFSMLARDPFRSCSATDGARIIPQIFQFLTFTAQSQTCFKRMADFIRLATTSPSSIKTSYNWIPYDGHAQKLKEGVGKLREWLASIVERADKDGEWAKEGVGSVKEMYRKVARK